MNVETTVRIKRWVLGQSLKYDRSKHQPLCFNTQAWKLAGDGLRYLNRNDTCFLSNVLLDWHNVNPTKESSSFSTQQETESMSNLENVNLVS